MEHSRMYGVAADDLSYRSSRARSELLQHDTKPLRFVLADNCTAIKQSTITCPNTPEQDLELENEQEQMDYSPSCSKHSTTSLRSLEPMEVSSSTSFPNVSMMSFEQINSSPGYADFNISKSNWNAEETYSDLIENISIDTTSYESMYVVEYDTTENDETYVYYKSTKVNSTQDPKALSTVTSSDNAYIKPMPTDQDKDRMISVVSFVERCSEQIEEEENTPRADIQLQKVLHEQYSMNKTTSYQPIPETKDNNVLPCVSQKSFQLIEKIRKAFKEGANPCRQTYFTDVSNTTLASSVNDYDDNMKESDENHMWAAMDYIDTAATAAASGVADVKEELDTFEIEATKPSPFFWEY